MSAPLTILGLVTEAYGGRGGIAQSCRDVVAALATHEAVVRIDLVPRHAPDAVGALPPKVTQRAPRAGRLAYSAAALAASRPRPNIIFCNHLYMAPLAAIIARLSGARLIVQLHGIEIWEQPSKARRRGLEAASALWCVSRDTRARALSFANTSPERAIVVNNCVSEQFAPGDRDEARTRLSVADRTLLLTVGRLDSRERYKGHDRVIALLPALARMRSDILYLIVGEGDDRARLKKLAVDHAVGDRVRFLGNVPPAMLPALYRAADVFVMPSTGEGFGIAFVEAMACGTPAVGLAAGGASDALADGALGACVRESELEDALRAALSSPRGPAKLAAAAQASFSRSALNSRIAQALQLLQEAA